MSAEPINDDLTDLHEMRSRTEWIGKIRALNQVKRDHMLNTTTGVGGPNDKSFTNIWLYEYPNPYVLDAMHQGDTVAGRIVELPPRDALAKGFEVKSPEPIPWRKDVVGDAFQRWLRKNKVMKRFRYAMILARIYGGAGIVLHVDDGRPPDQPVDMDNIRSITLTRARDRWELIPIDWFTDFNDPRYEEPKVYNVVPRSYGGATVGAPQTVHADRILRFDGYELTPEAWARNLWWGGSVLWRCKEKIERFVGAEQAMAILLTEAKEDILYLKGYANIQAAKDGKELVNDRVTDISTTRGLLGTTILDSEDKYETRMRDLKGLPGLYQSFMLSVAQAAEMPLTLIFGDAAKGLSADDKAGRTYYASTIANLQDEQVMPPLEQLLMLAFASEDGPTAGAVNEGWHVEFPPYEEETPREAAERQKLEAEADNLNISNGIYTPDDARTGRYLTGAPGHVIVEPQEEAEEGAAPDVEDVARTALNGAQVKSMVDIAKAAQLGEISREVAEAIIIASFPVDPVTAKIIAGTGEGEAAPPPAIAEQVEEEPAVNAEEGTEEDAPAMDEEPTNFPEEGGAKKVSLRNSQHRIFDPAYAADLKENWPEIWDLGGNVEGNNQFRRLMPIAARGGNVTTETEDMAVRKREAWGSRHKGNHRIAGVVAQVKWLVVGAEGEGYQKRLIEARKDFVRKKRAKKDEDVKMDPYAGPDDLALPRHVKALPKDKRAQWVKVFNATLEEHPGDEARAFRNANAVGGSDRNHKERGS